MREQRTLLGYNGDPPPVWWHVHWASGEQTAIEADLTAVNPLESGDAAQQRRLAATRWTENCDEGSGWYGKVDTGKGLRRANALITPRTVNLLTSPPRSRMPSRTVSNQVGITVSSTRSAAYGARRIGRDRGVRP